MTARKVTALFLMVSLAAGGAAIVGWKKAAQLRKENEGLRAELAQARGALAETEGALNESANLTRAEATAQKNELMRLRNEVTQLRSGSQSLEALRAENSQLKSQLQQVRTAANQPALSPPPLTQPNQAEHFPREQWNFAGYDTPAAALVSAIWAMREGRPEVYLDSLSPEEQQRMALRWQDQSEEQVAAKHQQDVAQISGMRILTSENLPGNETRMTVMLDGLNRTEEVRMHQVNGQWKFGGFIRDEPSPNP